VPPTFNKISLKFEPYATDLLDKYPVKKISGYSFIAYLKKILGQQKTKTTFQRLFEGLRKNAEEFLFLKLADIKFIIGSAKEIEKQDQRIYMHCHSFIQKKLNLNIRVYNSLLKEATNLLKGTLSALDWYEILRRLIESKKLSIIINDCQKSITENMPVSTRLLIIEANQGNTNSQILLGQMYVEGNGVAQNFSEGFKWFMKAAECGNAEAQYNLGVMFQSGLGITQNNEQAIEWWIKAAEQNNEDAKLKLKALYASKKTNHDDTETFKWFSKFAKEENDEAQYNLGMMYLNGKGTKVDKMKAIKWFMKAAKQGNEKAQYNLGLIHINGIEVSQNNTEIFEWVLKAAEKGNSEAQCSIALMYLNGNGVEKDEVEAFKWMCEAADQNNKTAQYNLGLMYLQGLGIDQNYTEAFRWVYRAAEKGDKTAQYELGIMYEKGLGVMADEEESLEWYRKAAKQEHKEAQRKIDQVNFLSDNDENKEVSESSNKPETLQNKRDQVSKAFFYICFIPLVLFSFFIFHVSEKSTSNRSKNENFIDNSIASRGSGEQNYNNNFRINDDLSSFSPLLIYKLGCWYLTGVAMPQDYKKAVQCFKKAAIGNIAEANYAMGYMYINGLGVPRDLNLAIVCLTKALNLGVEKAKKPLIECRKKLKANNKSNNFNKLHIQIQLPSPDPDSTNSRKIVKNVKTKKPIKIEFREP
jgi:TPR repeat protein